MTGIIRQARPSASPPSFPVEGPNHSARFYWISGGGLTVGPGFAHEPVMVREVAGIVAELSADSGTVVDATVGGAGHSEAMLRTLGAGWDLLGIDRDPVALDAAAQRLSSFGERVTLVRGDFRDVAPIVRREGREPVQAVVLDLGVSSPQFDVAARGFSYRNDGPLDMRMDPSGALTASEIVNSWPEDTIRDVIARYGEERFAGRIASAIVKRRALAPFETTTDLAAVVKEAIPAATRRTGPHPARRTFQGLRIAVNDELGALEAGLDGALSVLAQGGRLVVIAYHSLEDRIVKRFMRAHSGTDRRPPGLPVTGDAPEGMLRALTPRPLRPGTEEISINPRSESALLRAAERTGAEAAA